MPSLEYAHTRWDIFNRRLQFGRTGFDGLHKRRMNMRAKFSLIEFGCCDRIITGTINPDKNWAKL